MHKHSKSATFIAVLILTSLLFTVSSQTENKVMIAHAAPSNSLVPPKANSWAATEPISTNCWQLGTAVVDGKIYAISGLAESRDGPVLLNTTEQFDPATNVWTTRSSMPFPSAPTVRFPFGVAACNGKIYAIGVINFSLPSLSVFAYNPQTDTWETMKSILINATSETIVTANTVNGIIYLMGKAATGLFNVAYDPVSENWAVKSVPANGEIGDLSAVIDQKIYVIGGEVNGSINATLTQVYDTTTNSWITEAPLPSWVTYAAAVATTGAEAPKRVYVFGESVGVYSGSFMYDTVSNSWLAFDALPESVVSFALANVNDQIYVIGGYIPPVISGYPNQTLVYTPFGYGGASIPTPEPSATPTPKPSITPSYSVSSLPSSPPIVEWAQIYETGQSQDVIQTSDGGYLIVGSALIKTGAEGNEQWNTVLGAEITMVSAVQSASGGYVVGGVGAGKLPKCFALVKISSSGVMIWNKTYSNLYAGVGEDDRFASLFATSDGGYVLAGTMNAYTGAHKPSYPWLLKVNSEGNVVWSKTYTSGNLLAAAPTKDEGYVFFTPSPVGGMLLAKVDASGLMEWNQSYSNLSHVSSLVQANDGGYVISGNSPNGELLLSKTDWLGNMQWNRTYATPSNDTVNCGLTKTNDGGYAIVGYTNVGPSAPNASGVRIWILKTDSNGNAQWNQTYGGPNGTEGRVIIQTSDSGYVIAGQVDYYKEVNSNWPSFIYVTKLSYPTQSVTQLAFYIILLTIAIAVVVVVIVLRKKVKLR